MGFLWDFYAFLKHQNIGEKWVSEWGFWILTINKIGELNHQHKRDFDMGFGKWGYGISKAI